MSKAGPRGLRSALIHCADTARRQDPQLAAIYHAQMTTRNATHLKALCVVAARLAERAWVTLADAQPYQLRDVDGGGADPHGAQPMPTTTPKATAAGRPSRDQRVINRDRARGLDTPSGLGDHVTLTGRAPPCPARPGTAPADVAS